MSRLIDLSLDFPDQAPVYPGDTPSRLLQAKTIDEDGYTAFILQTGLHVGTHLDSPLHFRQNGAMVADLPLETFLGKGRLLDIRGEGVVGLESNYDSQIKQGDIVLFWTGHSATYGTDAYYHDHPVLHEDWADFLIKKRVKLVGFDLPSPDAPPFPMHRKLLGAGIPLMENLTNLGELVGWREFEVMAFPLKIRAEGSPVRVVARECLFHGEKLS